MSEAAPKNGDPSPSARILAQAAGVPAEAAGLSITQQAALAGKTIRDAAASAGVARWTLHRWLRDDPRVRAAYNAWRQELVESTHARLLRTAELAAATVQRQIARGDGRLALALLDRLGLVTAVLATPGPADPDLARDELAIEREEELQALNDRAYGTYHRALFHGNDEHRVKLRQKFDADAPKEQPAPEPPPAAQAEPGNSKPDSTG